MANRKTKLQMPNVAFYIFYPTAHIVAAAIGFLAILGLGFALRDGFCYKFFLSALTVGMHYVALFVLPLPIIAAEWAGARMRMSTRWLIAFMPVGLLLASWLGTMLAEYLSFVATREHCYAGHPERQDDSAPSPETSKLPIGVVLILLIATPVAALVVFVLSVTRK